MRRTRLDRARRLIAAGTALLVTACATLTVPQEQQIGAQVAMDMRRELVLLSDRTVVDYVETMGRRILAAAPPQPFEYHFFVVVDDEINAFAAPAGYIYIHSETILKARNASELAGVIAHEIGHIAKRHIAQNYNRARNTSVLQQVAVIGVGVAAGGNAAGAANILTGLGAMAYLNRFTREAEAEADAFAVETMPRARYHPSGLLTFFVTLQNEGGDAPPAFLSDHPTTRERIESGKALIDSMQISTRVRVDDGGRLEIIQQRIRLLQKLSQPRKKKS